MDLTAAAAGLGLAREYWDARGHLRQVGEGTLQALAAAMPPPAPHPLLAAPLVLREGVAAADVLSDAAQFPLQWTLARPEDILHGAADGRPLAWPPGLPPDVYQLTVTSADGAADARAAIVAPRRAFSGHFDRVWLLTAQLYSLRSARNWGIGDFSDLADLMRLAAAAGAAGIGLNPLHALFDDHPSDSSPYSPNSRLFLNPIYLDAETAPGLPADFRARHAAAIDAARAGDLVDYAAVARLKWQALREAYDRFIADPDTAPARAFARYRAERGPLLARFACFEFLRRHHAGPWWEWPEPWRRPDEARLAELHRGPEATAIGYFEYLQWLADSQLGACKTLAADLGMPVGLYLDVAVGVKADGFDAWQTQDVISRQASVGAPPDLLNTVGQDWGLAGFTGTGLDGALFRPFRDMMAATMRHAGAIRLDHVLWLQRMYLIPTGFAPSEGTYVQMPFDALLAVTALESAAHRCVVIGEDLGTVPEGFREKLADHGLWSYQVMIFERGPDGAFKPAEHYPSEALVTFSTHDLPTFAGWLSRHDLGVKHGLGIDPGESDDERGAAHHRLGEALQRAASALDFDSVLEMLARTPSRLLAVAIEDLLGIADQANVPGTIDQHPNWRRRLPVPLEALGEAVDPQRLRRLMGARSCGG
jgi:4-alpha-glucanotransferase